MIVDWWFGDFVGFGCLGGYLVAFVVRVLVAIHILAVLVACSWRLLVDDCFRVSCLLCLIVVAFRLVVWWVVFVV